MAVVELFTEDELSDHRWRCSRRMGAGRTADNVYRYIHLPMNNTIRYDGVQFDLNRTLRMRAYQFQWLNFNTWTNIGAQQIVP